MNKNWFDLNSIEEDKKLSRNCCSKITIAQLDQTSPEYQNLQSQAFTSWWVEENNAQCLAIGSSLRYELMLLVTDEVISYGESMFQDFTNVVSVIGLDQLNFGTEKNIYNFNFMFKNCSNLKEVDLSKIQLGQNISISLRLGFQNCKALTKLQLPKAKLTLTAYELMGTFVGCSSLPAIDLSPLTIDVEYVDPTVSPINLDLLFGACNNLKYITGLNGWDWGAGEVIYSAKEMLAGCSSLQSINIGDWSLQTYSNAADFFQNFFGCNERADDKFITVAPEVGPTAQLSEISLSKDFVERVLQDENHKTTLPTNEWYDADGYCYNIIEVSPDVLDGKTLYQDMNYLHKDEPLTQAQMIALADAIRHVSQVNSWMTVAELIELYDPTVVINEEEDED